MRRRRPTPRTDIPDWRDPNMKVFREQMNGLGERRAIYLKPEQEQRNAQTNIMLSKRKVWSKDPSYNWRKSKDDAS